MARLYERFLKVLQNWPVNPEYPLPLRSLPEHLRKQGKISFTARGEFSGDTQQCEKRIASLERLSKDHWARAYPRTFQSGALGVASEHCRFALSDDYQKSLETSRVGLFIEGIIGSFRKGSQEGKA